MASELFVAPVAGSVPQDASRSERHDYHQPGQLDQEKEHQLAVQAAREKFVERIAKSEGLDKGRLVIEKDSDTGRYIHKLVDPKSGEVVRQWPDDAWLAFAKEHGPVHGLWVDTQA